MKDLNKIGEELFSKLRGRFKNITIGNQEGVVTNVPGESRFYDFRYGDQGGKVSVSLDEKSVVIMYSEDLFDDDNTSLKTEWYDFLKEIRVFAKKRMLNFEVRDIQKSNLEKRDYKFLSTKNGENTMTESTMYGTSKTSYQNIADARICVKHSESINQELAGGRSQKIGSIYIESTNGERFKYPFKHLNGARAMARHVAEGGNMYDDFGKHIVGLSEEMNKLRKFKTYMSRSSVMAEGLAGYMDVVNERIETVKSTVAKLQNKAYYTETTSNFTIAVMEDVPEDVATDWTAQLTIKQFNEELKGVFPYIYKLVSEANAVTTLGPEDILGEAEDDKQENGTDKMNVTDADKINGTPAYKRMKAGDPRYNDKTTKEDAIPTTDDIEAGFEEMMGQFSEKAKPDFLDMDKDGDTSEPMKKAINDKKDGDDDEDADEGNAYANKVRQAKMNGKKKGDKIDGPDGDEITLEKDQQVALPEKILSLFDREQGAFPKGETAVLTMVEKDYGEQYINPAKKFIEQIMSKYESVMQGPAVQEMEDEHEPEKVTMAVTASIDALKAAAGIGESERQRSNSNASDIQSIKALAGL